MVASVFKTAGDVYAKLIGHKTNIETGVVTTIIDIRDAVDNVASFSHMEYSLDNGSTWATCNTTQVTQPIDDLGVIFVTQVLSRYEINWAFMGDLWYGSSYNVKLRIVMNDQADDEGIDTSPSIRDIGAIGLVFEPVTGFIRPTEYESDLYFVFDYPGRSKETSVHFLLEVDTTPTFNSGDLKQYDSSIDQTGWLVNGEDMESYGAILPPDKIVRIGYSNSELTALDADVIYYYRVLVSSGWEPSIYKPTDYDGYLTTDGYLIMTGRVE